MEMFLFISVLNFSNQFLAVFMCRSFISVVKFIALYFLFLFIYFFKAKIALLGKLTNLGRSWTHVPKNQIPIADQRARDFKGEFQEYTGGEGWLHAEEYSHV